MSNEVKFAIGLVLGFVGYCAYKKLKRTQTIQTISDTLNIPGSTTPVDVSTIAGLRMN